MLKGIIQGPSGAGGGQLSGSGVTSVGIVAPAEFITGPPVTSSGNLTFDWSGTPIAVAHGGTGLGSFAANSILKAGPSSTSPFTSVPLNNLTSNFLRGDGVFAPPPPPPAGGTGTVTSVDMSPTSEFVISGNPITGAGTLLIGWKAPVPVAHGGSGMGSFAANSILQAGLTSTGPFQSIPLNNLTSNFLRGDGQFAAPPPPPPGGTGTVTSVDLGMSSEFTISGNPITVAGTILIGWKGPLGVAHGGTGIGSFAASSILQAGLTSTGPFQSIPLNNLTSNFLRGDGVFAAPPPPPAAGAGTVTSVAMQMTSEFNVSGSPVTSAGTLAASFVFQSSHSVLIGPSSDADSRTPAFRQLVSGDIPQTMIGKTLNSTTLNAPNIGQQLLVFGSTVNWNLESGTIAVLTVDSTAFGTLSTPANFPVAGGSAILKLIQGGTGFVFSYVSAFRFANNRTLPTMSSCPGQTDILSFYMDSSTMWGTGLTNLK